MCMVGEKYSACDPSEGSFDKGDDGASDKQPEMQNIEPGESRK